MKKYLRMVKVYTEEDFSESFIRGIHDDINIDEILFFFKKNKIINLRSKNMI